MSIPYGELDPGIRETVRWLAGLGFVPTDSGDGVTKEQVAGCTLPVPHVHMKADPADPRSAIDESLSLLGFLRQRGIDFDFDHEPNAAEQRPAIQVTYSPVDGKSIISLYNVNDAMLEQATKSLVTANGA